MKITKIKKLDGCLEGTYVKDVEFDGEITREFILYLGNLGKLIFQEELKKPFFKIIVRGDYTIKGSMGNNSVRMILASDNDDVIFKEIGNYVEQWSYEL